MTSPPLYLCRSQPLTATRHHLAAPPRLVGMTGPDIRGRAGRAPLILSSYA